ncbi:very-short-patch-repair endonuclease [Lysobacter niastensis]|uniref:Very-short-patch-repair endonuclease n=1 Tax=Lysobacter niastensis TaxID=380629 RepID=A0ABU1WCB7_9GAMM|nr:endonuclease domain-containing protein [Lysobacter niastensis]MDR7135281.1 very-short-patch-repair endonuclease [Lysobacter niastensis]
MGYRQRARLPTNTLEAARSLRKEMTDAERKIWRHLRDGQLAGMKFRRQHPLPPYVVDFCCLDAGLVIELDGSQHTQNSDAVRTRFLEAKGYKVLRLWNNDVLLKTDAVIEAIWNAVGRRPLIPTPLPMGEGL